MKFFAINLIILSLNVICAGNLYKFSCHYDSLEFLREEIQKDMRDYIDVLERKFLRDYCIAHGFYPDRTGNEQKEFMQRLNRINS